MQAIDPGKSSRVNGSIALHRMSGIALLEMPICRHAFRKMLTRVVLALFSRVELGNGAVIAHDARPDFATGALRLEFIRLVVHRVQINVQVV
jgi:hypothetical protein